MSDTAAGMFFLVLSVVFTSAFSLIMKFSQEKGYSVLAVGAVNYLAAAVAAAFLTSRGEVRAVSFGMCLLAAASGLGFLLTYLLLAYALRRRGITVPNAAVQVAMVVPIVPSVLLWHEHLGLSQATGVLISVLAILLLTPSAKGAATGSARWAYLVVPGIFLMSGATRVAQKAITELAPGSQQPALALIWFGAAGVFSLAVIALTGWPRRAGEWTAGILLGFVNLGSLVFLLRALSLVPAVVAFPAYGSLSIVLVTASAFLLWNERPGRSASLGILTGLLSVVLVNLR